MHALFFPQAHFELAPNQQIWNSKIEELKKEEGARGFDSLQRFLHSTEREPMPQA